MSIPEHTTSARVRAVLSFPAPLLSTFFGYVALDPYVQGVSGVGMGDTITCIAPGQLPANAQDVQVQRFGSILKIDDIIDNLPPGVGTRWVQRSQRLNFGIDPRPFFYNPVILYEYTLVLDGTEGDRLVTAAWSTDTAFGYRPFIITAVWDFPHRGQQWRHPVDEEQLTIRVVPTASSSLVGGVVLAGLLARRRRGTA